jgi:glycosyltransferase involved in cell wall biosynthesis
VPKVSIVTPCYNCGPFVGRSIRSVAAQSFTDWEHVVVDDGSTDDSAAVVAALIPVDARLRLVHQANAGVVHARNRGYRTCSPESAYVLFLDADDCLEPRMLEVLVDYLDQNPRVGVAFCDYVFINEDDRPILPTPRRHRLVPSRFWVRPLRPAEPNTPFVSVYNVAPVMEGLSLIRRSVFDQTPGWDESFGQGFEGLQLFLRVALRTPIHFVPEVLYRYRVRAGQASANPRRQRDQLRKLFRQWADLPGLSAEQRRAVAAARCFRDRRVLPYCAWVDCGRHLRAGCLLKAAWSLGAAVWRHVRGILVSTYG